MSVTDNVGEVPPWQRTSRVHSRVYERRFDEPLTAKLRRRQRRAIEKPVPASMPLAPFVAVAPRGAGRRRRSSPAPSRRCGLLPTGFKLCGLARKAASTMSSSASADASDTTAATSSTPTRPCPRRRALACGSRCARRHGRRQAAVAAARARLGASVSPASRISSSMSARGRARRPHSTQRRSIFCALSLSSSFPPPP